MTGDMDSLLAASALGFLLGMRHAADPDHVLAISTLLGSGREAGAGRGPGRGWLLGACWGMGHTATLFSAGAAVILLKVAVSPRLEAALEAAVGAMLVALGAMSLRGGPVWGLGEHTHEHSHGGEGESHRHHLDGGPIGPRAHTHPHAHSPALDALAASVEAAGPRRLARSFAVGMLHGLAGSGAVALLVLAAMPGTRAALAYLAVFGLGSLAGMALCTAALEAAVEWARGRGATGPRLERLFGAATAAFGLYIMAHQAMRLASRNY